MRTDFRRNPPTLFLAVLLFWPLTAAPGQFELQVSHTTASLRGIDASVSGVAWASGSNGTILRTVNEGSTWLPCATPAGGAKLDFRGVQAFDADTAVVMSSGKGELSRIYKTTDACHTWKLIFTSPDPEGFFDTIRRVTAHQLYLLGDPVNGKFTTFLSRDTGDTWFIADDPGLAAEAGDGAFAASNSSLLALGATLFFGSGGANAARVYATRAVCPATSGATSPSAGCPIAWVRTDVPVASHSAASGVFSLAGRVDAGGSGRLQLILVAVGGAYDKPQDGTATAATSNDGGKSWKPAILTPAGYRSAVAYDRASGAWLTVGTSGADVSHDDGTTWKPLRPSAAEDTPETSTGWNAIGLPYVVGGKGRIGRLRPDALKP